MASRFAAFCAVCWYCSSTTIAQCFTKPCPAPPGWPLQAPMMPITFQPANVAQRVYLYGDPLQGNTCPANATNPFQGCPPG